MPAVFFWAIQFPDMNSGDTAWSDYWVSDGAGGEVFVDREGNPHPALAKFWRDILDGLAPGTRIIDVACGAGSIYAHLPADHGFALTGTDISAEALAALEKRIPGVNAVQCGADEIPCDDASFDLVLSQFGVEYAGIRAFAEAGRLLAPGGRLRALVHIEDGLIDRNNRAQLEEASVVQDCRFIDLALDLAEAVYSGDRKLVAAAEKAFVPAGHAVSAGIRRCPRGVHVHLFRGFRQLYERRQAYAREDVTGWLEQMGGEVERSLDRLTRMRNAAMSTDDMHRIAEELGERSLSDVRFREFRTGDNEVPVAWFLQGYRAASA